jgi:hypothetical protein
MYSASRPSVQWLHVRKQLRLTLPPFTGQNTADDSLPSRQNAVLCRPDHTLRRVGPKNPETATVTCCRQSSRDQRSCPTVVIPRWAVSRDTANLYVCMYFSVEHIESLIKAGSADFVMMTQLCHVTSQSTKH